MKTLATELQGRVRGGSRQISEEVPASLVQRERTESQRSATEAANLAASALRAPAARLARYAAPPANTVHPLEYAFHLLGDVRGKTILEYGCGDGINTIHLANRGATVVALDLSPDLIDIARRRVDANEVRNVHLVVGSGHHLPLPDNSVDVVFGIAILHHLDLALAAREIARVTRKGGVAIFQEPVRNSRLLRIIRRLIPYRSPDVSPFERPLTDKELRECTSGWASYHVRPFHTLPVGLSAMVLCRALPKLRSIVSEGSLRLDSAILRMVPAAGYFSPVKVLKIVR